MCVCARPQLARILRASRIFSRWENSISMSYASQDLYKWGARILFLLHILACALGLLAQMQAPPRDATLAAAVQAAIDGGDADCYGCLPNGTTSDETSLCRSPCLTPCEVAELAKLRASAPYSDIVAEQRSFIWSEQNWICRYSQLGKV